jgi:hypothetical protein
LAPDVHRGDEVLAACEACCDRGAEIQAAGPVESFLGGPGRVTGRQDGVLVAAGVVGVEGEAPPVGVAGVAQAAQREFVAVVEQDVEVGESGSVTNGELGDGRPAPGPLGKALS